MNPHSILHRPHCGWLFTLLYSCFALILASCTIIDNDLRDLPDTPGFKDVVHEETDNYTVDYQYNETTRVLDELTLSYVAGIDYGEAKLYMRESTPDDLLPTVGQVMHHGVCDELPYGICHRATAISRENEFYAVSLERAALDEVFKKFSFKGDFEVAGDFEEEELDSTDLAAANARTVTRAEKHEADAAIGWQEIDLFANPLLSAVAIAKGFDNTERYQLHFKAESGYVTGYADVAGSVLIRWRPILKGSAIIDIDNSQFDISARIGTELEIIPKIEGSLGITVDLVKAIGLDNVLKGQIAVYPPLALFLTFGFDLEFDFKFSGSIYTKFSKKFYTDLGGRNNIKGKTDGPYITKKNYPVTTEMVADSKGKWDWDWSFDFETSLMGGADINLLFGSPKEFPNVGLGVKALIGPRMRTTYSGNIQKPFYKVMRVSIGIKAEAKLFLNIFKNVTYDWNFGDALAKALGVKDGLVVDIPGTAFDQRLYPSITSANVMCLNPDESGTPRFDLHFTVPEGGLYINGERTIRPIVSIVPHGVSSAPLLEKSDFSELSVASLKKPNTYSWTINSDELKRDVIYDAVIEMTDNGKSLCTTTVPFTSTSPSAQITYDEIVAQEERVSTKGKKSKTSNVLIYPAYYDYKFITMLNVVENGDSKVKRLGFKIGDKNYDVPNTVSAGTLVVLWGINNSSKKDRSIVITPWVTYTKRGEEMTAEQNASTIKLTYDPTRNTYDNVAKGNYKCSGFDATDDIITDVDMSGKTVAARRQTTPADDDSPDEESVEVIAVWPMK